MNYLKLGLIGLIIFAVGSIVGYYSKPAKIETKEVKVESKEDKQKISDLESQITKLNFQLSQKTNTNKITRTEIRPDGTTIKEEVENDSTESQTSLQQQSQKDKNVNVASESKSSISDTKSTVITNQSKWSADLFFKTNLQPYGGNLSYKVIGPFKMGVWGTIEKSGGFSLGMDF